MTVCRLARAALLAVCLCGSTVSVSAGEMPRPFTWSGFYVGGHLGKLSNTGGVTQYPSDASAKVYFDSNLVAPDPIGSDSSTLYGAQLGYNYQISRFVVGVEADASLTDIGGSASDSTPYVLSTTIGWTADRKLDRFATVRARIGLTLFERTLLYATGGVAFGHAALSNTFTVYNATMTPICGAASGLCAVGSTSTWLTGWIVGGGLEQAVGDHWSVKLEGLHYDLGTLSHSYDDPAAFPLNYALFGSTAEFKGNIVRIGLNYRF